MPSTIKDFIKTVTYGYDNKDVSFYLDYLAEDVRWNIIGKEPVIGKENFIEAMIKEELESFPVITIINVISNGEYVIVESRGKAVIKKGTHFIRAYCDIYRLRNGKICEVTTYIVETVSK